MPFFGKDSISQSYKRIKLKQICSSLVWSGIGQSLLVSLSEVKHYPKLGGDLLSIFNNLKNNSFDEWIQKLWYIYTMEFYAAERKEELIPFARAWMELESIMLSEISQAVRDKYHTISLLMGT